MNKLLLILGFLFIVVSVNAQKINRSFPVIGYDSIPYTVPNENFKRATVGYVDSVSRIFYYNYHMPNSQPDQWVELTGGVHEIIYLPDSTGFVTLNNLSEPIDTINFATVLFSIDSDSLYTKPDSICILNGNCVYIQNNIGGGYNDTILPYGVTGVGRVPQIGDNLDATTIKDWIEWWYISNYQQPNITMNNLSPSLIEVGTSRNYTLSGSITNNCSFTLSNRLVDGTSFAGSSYSKSVNWQPLTKQTKTYQASVQWDEAGSTCADGTPNTGTDFASRSVNAVHPVLWGVSSNTYTSGSVAYNIWQKLVASEGNKTLTLPAGTDVFIYFLVPKSWNDFNLSSILDHNNFELLPSFTTHDVTVTSTGLVNNWTQAYKLYKLNSLTSTNGTEDYQIKR